MVAAIATAAASLVTAASATAPAASATAPASAPTAPTVTRSAHVDFGNCNAQHVVRSVTVAGRAFTPIEPVTYTVRLRNAGRTTCGARWPNTSPRRGDR